MAELTLDLRAERDGADVALSDGLCGLGEAAARALAAETLRRAGIGAPVAIDVLVTDDDALRRLNREYRGRDDVTDVLSFPLLAAPLVHAPAAQLWSDAEDDDDDDARSLAALAARDAALGTFVAHDDETDDAAADGADDEGDHAAEAVAFVAPAGLPTHLGDIVIARGAVTRQAAAAGHGTARELAFLLAHGILHLVGYDDHTEAGYAAMVALQHAALDAVGLRE